MSIRLVVKNNLKKLHIFHPIRRIACEFFTLRQNMLSEQSIEKIYERNYHLLHGYGIRGFQENEGISDYVIKREQAKCILKVIPLKRILIGGCSGGMAVNVFRELQVDAWGFDISPNLDQILLPDVRQHVLRGSMTCIPFGSEDKFEALITTDVLEHIQLTKIDMMMNEMEKLKVKWMIHLINHTLIQRDHMTLKPIGWWEERFLRIGYKRRVDMKCPTSDIPGIYGVNGNPEHVYTFWEKL